MAAGSTRPVSAFTTRSKHRLRHNEAVFSSVGRGESRRMADWAEQQLDRREAEMFAAAEAGRESRRPWVNSNNGEEMANAF